MQTKQAHWNVKGPHCIALHELFDRIAEENEDFADNVAERIVALGDTAEGMVGVVEKHSKLPTYPTNLTSGRDHVETLSSLLALEGKSIRAAIDHSAELGDADMADLLTGISRDLDK